MSNIVISDVSFGYNANDMVLHSVSLTVQPGKFVCLVGPSGCGKSTLLRLIAGLERPLSGSISIGDMVVSNGSVLHMPPEQRSVGLVFQQPSLFPHLTVADNIAFGMQHLSRDEQQKRVAELLDKIGLEAQKFCYPHMLSSGQHQRVALARAIAPMPKVMLLDEPFANLDDVLRRRLREELVALLREYNIATLMVTHEPEEALMLADHMALFTPHGTIRQQGTPAIIHDTPIDIEAARFFGEVNIVSGTLSDNILATPIGTITWDVSMPAHTTSVDVIIRPEGLRIAEEGQNGYPVHILSMRHTGAGWLIRAQDTEGKPFIFHHIYGKRPDVGETVSLMFSGSHMAVV